MKQHRITIRATKQEPLDLDRFVSALLALAIARVEEERTRAEQPHREEIDG